MCLPVLTLLKTVIYNYLIVLQLSVSYIIMEDFLAYIDITLY